MKNPTTLSTPQPLVCNIVGCPQRELGVVIVPIRHDQMIEAFRNHWTIMLWGLIERDDLRLWPVSRNREFPETFRSASDPVRRFYGVIQTNVGVQLETSGEIMVVGLYAVIGWVEQRVWWEWEARICHCDRRLSVFRKWVSGQICDHLLGQGCSCAIEGRVVFPEGMDTGLNCHLVTYVIK